MADRYFRHEEDRRAEERAEWLSVPVVMGVAALFVIIVAFLVASL